MTTQTNPTPHSAKKQTMIVSTFWIRWGAIFRHNLLFIAWGLMEVALIVPLAYAIMAWLMIFRPFPLTLSLLFLILTPLYLSQLLTKFHIPPETQRNVMIGSGIFIIIWAIRTFLYDGGSLLDFSWIGQLFRSMTQANNNAWHRDVGLFGLIAVCWWRGMLLVTRELDVSRFGDRFRTGGLFIAPLILLIAALRLEWSVLSYLLLFLMAGLTAVALTRIERAEKDQSAILDTIDLRWFLTILGSGIAIILLPSALSFAMSGDSGTRLGNFLAPIWLGIQFAFSSFILTFIFLLSPLIAVFERFAGGFVAFFQRLYAWFFTEREQPLEAPADPAQQINELITELQRQAQQKGYTAALDWNLVLLILLFLGIMGVIIWLTRRYRGNRNMVENGRFNRATRGIFSRIIPNRQDKPSSSNSSQPLDWRTALTIRRIYAQMSRMATEQEMPREQNETPYEYLGRLYTLWPNHENETRRITRAFVKVRYGELPESREEFEAIKQAWDNLKREEVKS